jgi:hypothetical protein
MAGRVKTGRIPGGRCYGYDVVPGEDRGKRTINEAEAAIVRRICAEYVAGHSPRKIAKRLNDEGVPSPRGGRWNASTILGSRKRRNGILDNSLYAGLITYNRQRFVKDPATGRRQARSNPQDQWVTQDVPELRIVSPDLWQAVQDRRAAASRQRPEHQRRPKHLLSGLLICGSCGANMIVVTRMRDETYFGCSVRRNRDGCDNDRNVAATEVEARVIAALKRYLLEPEVIAAAIEAYRTERQRLSRERAGARGSMERELADTKRKKQRDIQAVEDGVDAKILAPRLKQLTAREEELEAQLALAQAPDVVELHPQAAERYRRKVEEIQAALAAGDAAGTEAVAVVRDLIQQVRVIPEPRGEPVGLEIAGDLAAILNMNGDRTTVMSAMVAGARNHLNLQLGQLLSAVLGHGERPSLG